MWDAAGFRELVSGRRHGKWAQLARVALQLAAGVYGAATAVRNAAFDCGWRRSYAAAVPVISIGNLTTGGTGKTPLAAWIARWFLDRNIRVVLVSRGYGAATSATPNDEALELAACLPQLVHLQQPDRVRAAARAVADHHAQLVLLDDGFQHRRLRRDLDIVLLDALEPFGYGHLLPRGLLRESIRSLRRAHVVGLSRADLLEPTQRAHIRQTVARYAPDALWVELAHKPVGLMNTEGVQRSWLTLAAQDIVAFSGIGNPQGFRRTLENLGYRLVAWREFPDHHPYSATDVAELSRWATEHADVATSALCTHKDLVKLAVPRLGPLPLEALMIEAEPQTGADQLRKLLTRLCPVEEPHEARLPNESADPDG